MKRSNWIIHFFFYTVSPVLIDAIQTISHKQRFKCRVESIWCELSSLNVRKLFKSYDNSDKYNLVF